MKQDAPPPQQRRWWWRWLRRLLMLGLLAMALAAAAGYWGWKERVRVLNALMERTGGDWRVKFDALDWENGALHLSQVRVTHVPTAQPVATMGRIEWQPPLGDPRLKNLGVVKVTGAVLDVPMAFFKAEGATPGAATATARPWRFEALDLAATKIVVHDEAHAPVLSATVQGKVSGGTSAGVFETADVQVADLTWGKNKVLSRLQIEAEMRGGVVEVRNATVQGGQVDLAWIKELSPALSEKLPPLQGSMEFEWAGHDVSFSHEGLITGGTHEARLKNLRLQMAADKGVIKTEVLDVKVAQDANGVWQVERGLLLRPEVEWTPELEEALLPRQKSSTPSTWKLRVAALEVKEGQVKLLPTELCPVEGSFGWNAKLEALEISPENVKSAAKQWLELAAVSLRWKRSDPEVRQPPFLLAKRAELEMAPDRLRESWFVDALRLDGLTVELTPENGPWFDKVKTTPPKPPSNEPQPWQRLKFGDLQAKDASFVMAMQLAERMEAATRFEIVTEQGKQRLRIVEAQMSIPKVANLPVLAFENVEVVASLPQMWEERRLESLKLRGGQVEVGDALMTLFSGKAEVVEEKVDIVSARWTAGKVEVERLGVTILNIAPGLPPVRFDVNFDAYETPLDLDGLAENVEPQRIVLSRLRIPSPYEPLRTVAEMDVIHVDYTLDGLLNRRIDRVEIVSPLLYVGEDLFWYVENYRKYMKGEAPTPDPSKGPPAPPKPAPPGWRVDTLAVSDGRLLLAPKGVPLAGFSRPFPFSFTSRLESGQLEAVFDIPSDDYTLKELKLEFRGMKGHVQFNLPMKDRNNNLTETFTVDQLRWKELHMEKAHLSVTYDANGIYGAFGGEAYDGYVNGAFDIYLDEVYTWDGWISGSDVALGPVTRALFPNYLLLEGAATGKAIATGNMNELYQGDVEFKNRSRGKFSIAALNDMISELPPPTRGDISQQIRRIGLETLRDFEYEDIDGKARFYGREGRGHLRFTGPQGARNIEVNVYDHRWKEEPKAASNNDE